MGDVTPLSNAELDSVSEELDRFGIKMLYRARWVGVNGFRSGTTGIRERCRRETLMYLMKSLLHEASERGF